MNLNNYRVTVSVSKLICLMAIIGSRFRRQQFKLRCNFGDGHQNIFFHLLFSFAVVFKERYNHWQLVVEFAGGAASHFLIFLFSL